MKTPLSLSLSLGLAAGPAFGQMKAPVALPGSVAVPVALPSLPTPDVVLPVTDPALLPKIEVGVPFDVLALPTPMAPTPGVARSVPSKSRASLPRTKASAAHAAARQAAAPTEGASKPAYAIDSAQAVAAGFQSHSRPETDASSDHAFDNNAQNPQAPSPVVSVPAQPGSTGGGRIDAAGRLPRTVEPKTYDLKIRVDPEAGTFSGEVSIAVVLKESAKEVTLHSLDLDIAAASVDGRAAAVSTDKGSESITLSLASPAAAGPAVITVKFSGALNKQMRGLYQSKATHAGKEERYAFTHFEPTSARRMFPSFDEPDMKAKFRLTVEAPEHLTVRSNQPAIRRDAADGWQTVAFEESPVMSTYLLALTAARLESKSRMVQGTLVTVWARPEDMGQVDFALDWAQTALERLNDYFGIRYQLPKLDLIAVPDFSAGAMENWGAIFFRDSALLADLKLSSTRAKRRVAEVVTHEIVHQWFGNLVTMKWWDDLWLNEAFATWLAYKVIDKHEPSWGSWLDYEIRKRRALVVDALHGTRPIQAKAVSSADIESMFDALSYEKGGSLLRMIENFIGEDAFRAGIREYMRKYQYRNTVAADLWAELEAASKKPVSKMAQDWLTKPGYPVVETKLVSAAGRRIRLAQERFDAHGKAPESSPWTIPVVVKYRLQGERKVRTYRVILKAGEAVVTLPGKGALAWAYPNADETGLFRVRLDATLLKALRSGGWRRLAPVERAGLLNHLWAQTKNGTLPMSEFLGTIAALKNDPSRLVLEDVSGYLRALERLLDEKDHDAFADYAAEVFGPHWRRLGWGRPTGEADDDKLSRSATLAAMAHLAQPKSLMSQADARLRRYLDDPKKVDASLAGVLLAVGAKTGDPALFDEYLARMRAASTPEQRDLFQVSLAEFRDPALVRRLLELTLTDDVRGQDIWKPLTRVLENPAAQAQAWEFIKAHWAEIRAKGGPKGATQIIGATANLWSRAWLEEARAFFNDPANRVPSADKTLKQALESLELGISFKEAQAKPLTDWLRRR